MNQDVILEKKVEEISNTLKQFKESLENFARTNRDKIVKDPKFRTEFHKMCLELGVDPLNSSKGLFGRSMNIGVFFYDLAVQVIDLCTKTKSKNGGYLPVETVINYLQKVRGRQFTEEDIETVIEKINEAFSAGYSVITLNKMKVIKSVQQDLSIDQTRLIQEAIRVKRDAGKCYLGFKETMAKFQWSSKHCSEIFSQLLRDGIVWIDRQASEDKQTFWFMMLCDE